MLGKPRGDYVRLLGFWRAQVRLAALHRLNSLSQSTTENGRFSMSLIASTQMDFELFLMIGFTPNCTCSHWPVMITAVQDEDRGTDATRPLVLKIIGQSLPGFHRQEQDILLQRLGAFQRHRTDAPVDVADLQLGYFARPKSQVQCATHDGVAALRPSALGRKGFQKTLDFVRRERTRPGS